METVLNQDLDFMDAASLNVQKPHHPKIEQGFESGFIEKSSFNEMLRQSLQKVAA